MPLSIRICQDIFGILIVIALWSYEANGFIVLKHFYIVDIQIEQEVKHVKNCNYTMCRKDLELKSNELIMLSSYGVLKGYLPI